MEYSEFLQQWGKRGSYIGLWPLCETSASLIASSSMIQQGLPEMEYGLLYFKEEKKEN